MHFRQQIVTLLPLNRYIPERASCNFKNLSMIGCYPLLRSLRHGIPFISGYSDRKDEALLSFTPMPCPRIEKVPEVEADTALSEFRPHRNPKPRLRHDTTGYSVTCKIDGIHQPYMNTDHSNYL
jgi:hypothetical protein